MSDSETKLLALMQLENAEGAFRFEPSGELLEHKIREGSELNPGVLDLLAHLCVANIAIATMQARGWETMTGMQGFYPIKGFTLVGLNWTAVVNSEYGVVIPNSSVDYEAAHKVLTN